MKPFAKAALSGKCPERMDPALAAKMEAQRWLNQAVTRLAEQVEKFEVRQQLTLVFWFYMICRHL